MYDFGVDSCGTYLGTQNSFGAKTILFAWKLLKINAFIHDVRRKIVATVAVEIPKGG